MGEKVLHSLLFLNNRKTFEPDIPCWYIKHIKGKIIINQAKGGCEHRV
ncbi:MAG: hypothetical protein ABIF17_04185 [Patescibacteria group bacterium]